MNDESFNKIININKFDINKDIHITNIRNFYNNYKQVDIYNINCKTPLQKIWIKLPKVKLYSNMICKNMNNSNINCKIILDKSNKELNDFINFINSIDSKINEHLSYLEKEYKNSIEKDKYYDKMKLTLPTIKVDNIYLYNFHIYNHNNKIINPNILNRGCYISCFLELQNVWISENKFSCNWSVLQMKTYPFLDFSKCMFLDEEPIKIDNSKENECFHCLHCINSHNTTRIITNDLQSKRSINPMLLNNMKNKLNTINNNKKKNNNNDNIKKKPVSFMPSLNDILNIKNRLKKINTNSKIKIKNNIKKKSFHPSLEEIINIKKKLIKVNTTNNEMKKSYKIEFNKVKIKYKKSIKKYRITFKKYKKIKKKFIKLTSY